MDEISQLKITEEVTVSKQYANWQFAEQTIGSTVECYRELFSYPPWNEWLKCSKCGTCWGAYDRTTLAAFDYMHCGEPLVDFWPRHQLVKELRHQFGKKGCSNWGAISSDVGQVGFCWGYPMAIDELENELKIKLGRVKGLKSERIAYQDEVGVLPRYENQGIAKAMVRLRFEDFMRQGLTYGIARVKEGEDPSRTYDWYVDRLGYDVIARYPKKDGRVIVGRKLDDSLRDLLRLKQVLGVIH